MSRRDFLKRLGMGAGSAMALMALEPFQVLAKERNQTGDDTEPIRMTYRVQHGSGEQISLLGFGMMRLPNDQDEVNELVDYAIAHGVNDHVLPLPDKQAADYAQRKQAFADGYKLALKDDATWASRCQDCELCLSKCPQQIRIPNQMARIVETLR